MRNISIYVGILLAYRNGDEGHRSASHCLYIRYTNNLGIYNAAKGGTANGTEYHCYAFALKPTIRHPAARCGREHFHQDLW